MTSKDIKLKIIAAGHKAVLELIKIAEDPILNTYAQGDDSPENGNLAADKLKNAAATKKLAIFDAFEILNRIESERESIEMAEKGVSKTDTKQGFAERRSK
jgi:hypothetical protein